MRIKTKAGKEYKVDFVGTTDVKGVDVATGKMAMIEIEDIVSIVKNSITLWDLIRGLFFKLKKLFKK